MAGAPLALGACAPSEALEDVRLGGRQRHFTLPQVNGTLLPPPADLVGGGGHRGTQQQQRGCIAADTARPQKLAAAALRS